MMKKAIIDKMMLGLLLLASVIVFIATTADDVTVRNKLLNLKKLTDATALGLANHYILDGDTDAAEGIVNDILDESALGIDAKNYITYTWDLVSDPKTVTVTISDYVHNTFWYRFLSKDEFIFESIESQASIEVAPSDDPRCVCGQSAGVGLIGRTLCVVGTDSHEQVQIASDSNKWKVKAVFDDGDWEEEEWYRRNKVDEIIVVALNGDDQIQLNDVDVDSLVDGGCGDDQIQGSTGPNTIYGNKGDDQIEGNDGNDILYGGTGDDQIQGGNGRDTLYTDGNDSTVDAGGNGGDSVENGVGYSDDCNDPVGFTCDGEMNAILVY